MCLALVGVSLICVSFIAELKAGIGVICMLTLILCEPPWVCGADGSCASSMADSFRGVRSVGLQITELHGCASHYHCCGERFFKCTT